MGRGVAARREDEKGRREGNGGRRAAGFRKLRGSRTETKVEKVDSARGTHPADTAADTSANRRSVASVDGLLGS